MKVRIDQGKLSFEPKPQPEEFVPVARMIAKGDPPDWLPLALAHFARFVSLPKPTYDVEVERKMLEAAEYLEEWLPIVYGHLDEFDLEVPDCIDQIDNALPDLIEILRADVGHKRLGHDGRHVVCVAAVSECYRAIHGTLRPGALREACETYWKGCVKCERSDSAKGDHGNWRRHLEAYAKGDGPWAREVAFAQGIVDLYKTDQK
jgi:hypothetical protein